MRAKKHSSVIERSAFDRISRPTASSSKLAGEAPAEGGGGDGDGDGIEGAVALILGLLRRE